MPSRYSKELQDAARQMYVESSGRCTADISELALVSIARSLEDISKELKAVSATLKAGSLKEILSGDKVLYTYDRSRFD